MSSRRLARRDEHVQELMDDPGCDGAALRRTVARFDTVNRLVAGWRGAYTRRLRPVLARTPGPARILDIGCGGGDVLRRLVTYARTDGFDVRGVGIDPDERCLDVARAAPTMPGVAYRSARSDDIVAAGDRFDIVVSNHLLHHLGPADLDGLWRDSMALTTGICLHSDILRSRIAYGAYAVGIIPFARGTFLRVDGLRSIRRSFRPRELTLRTPAGWTVETSVPFRVRAVWQPA